MDFMMPNPKFEIEIMFLGCDIFVFRSLFLLVPLVHFPYFVKNYNFQISKLNRLEFVDKLGIDSFLSRGMPRVGSVVLKKNLKNISGTPGDEILEKLCI